MPTDIHFYKSKEMPSAPSGSLWFNPETKRIYLFDGNGSTIFGSDIQSAKYENNILTLTNCNGSKLNVPISTVNSENLATLLGEKLNKIKVNNTIIDSVDLNFVGQGSTSVSVDGSKITISSPETIDASKITGTLSVDKIPIATSDSIGGVKIGSGLTITSDGTLSASGGGTADSVAWDNITGKPATFPPSSHTHSSSDITDLQSKLDSLSYSLPVASSSTLGGIKVGSGLVINNGVLSATGGGTADSVDWSNITNKPTIPAETSINNSTGNFTLGTGLALSGKTINCTVTAGSSYTLPTATTDELGGIIVGDGVITDSNGVLSIYPSEIDLSQCDNSSSKFITADDIPSGTNGTTFTPHVSSDGTLSWTNDGGETNPDPVNIKGPKGDQGEPGEKGADGTGVNILGSYTSESQLPSSGIAGDAYLINGDLYVWTGSSWDNVGSIQGPQGEKGDKGDPGTDGSNGSDGVDGTDGIGITDISGTDYSWSGAKNTVTVTLSDNTTKTFTVYNGTDGRDGGAGTNGKDGTNGTDGIGISDITSTDNTGSGEANTITVTLTNGSSKSFTVYNGEKGNTGAKGDDGADGKDGTTLSDSTITTINSLVESTIGSGYGSILCGDSNDKLTGIGASGASVDNSGNINASAFYETSDENLKWFTGEIPVDFEQLKTIPKQYFVWRNRETPTNIGTSAQKVQEIYPEIVSTAQDGHLTVDYGKLSIVALKAIDLLNEKIERLEAEIKELKSK